MTSNNLEAVELIIEVQSRLLSGATWGLIKPLDKALKLLQADEDIEVKEQASRCICNDCPIHGKTTPYEKPTKDTCGCLCHNPDALKWGCEHCAMPPQDATIHDVVNGTPKGQEAVQKAIDDSIKVQNEMTKKAQDTSLDEQLMEVMLYVRTTHEVEHNDNQWTREFVFSFDEAKAKINRLIVEAELKGFDIAFDCHDYDRLRAYKEQLTKELGDSNG